MRITFTKKQMLTFADLGLPEGYVRSLSELGIKHPTKIQEKVIPALLDQPTDLIGLAQTGTGKTAAYGLPLLLSIDASQARVQGLIIAPTRELVQQIQKQLFRFTKYVDERIFAEGVYGGEYITRQIKALKRPTHSVVATPSRLLDLLERKAVDITNVKTLVLDEADEMLSMGFQDDMTKILSHNTADRNTWLCLMPAGIKHIIKTYLAHDTIRLEVNRKSLVNENISHHFIQTRIQDKVGLILRLLAHRKNDRGVIFCRTKAGTRKLAE